MAELLYRIRSFASVVGAIAVITTITACGGGGSDPADVDPVPFDLVLESGEPTDLEPGDVAVFSSVTVTGINQDLAVVVIGGEYAIDGGDFTSAAGTISNNQTIQLRAPASTGYGEVVTVTLQLGDDFERTIQLTTRPKDETPEAFSFTAVNNQELGASATSNSVTITGIDSETPIRVENGGFSLDGGTTFVSNDTTIDDGQIIYLQGDASSNYETTVSVTLTVGTESEAFAITTRSKDTTPNAFEFTPAEEQEINTPVNSNAVTITGIDPETDISIENGSYSLDIGDTFINEAATINANQTVIVQVNNAADYESSATAILTVGTVSQNFVATTRAKDTTPEAFPIATVSGQELNVDVPSAVITVTGFDPDTTISVENGSYSLNSGTDFTSDAGLISADQQIIVQGRSANDFVTTTTVSLTVGTVTETFQIQTRERDTTPENLGTFTAVTDGDPNTTYTSNTLLIAENDVEGEVAISISEGGAYQINETGEFRTGASTISATQTVRVQATTPAEFDTPNVVTLTVGTETRTFSVMALEDLTPDAFGLTETVSEVAFGAEVNRGPFTIEGINTAVTITIENGVYEIVGNGFGFVSDEGVIEPGDQINIQATAPNAANETLDVNVNIGTITETLTIETLVDDTPPTAEIVFPPPVSMTQGGTILVRGTASDDISGVASVTVNDIPATDTSEEGDFSEWEVEVSLFEYEAPDFLENTLTVSVSDAVGLTNDDVASVSVRSDPLLGEFPDGNVPINNVDKIVFDQERQRFIVNQFCGDYLVAIDLATAERTPFTDIQNDLGLNDTAHGLLIEGGQLWMSLYWANELYTVDLASGEKTLFSVGETPVFSGPRSLFLIPGRDSIFVSNATGAGILEVNKQTGERSVFSSGGNGTYSIQPDALEPFNYLYDGVYDSITEQVYALDFRTPSVILSVSPQDGERILRADSSSEPITSTLQGLSVDRSLNRLLVMNSSFDTDGLIAIQLVAENGKNVGDKEFISTNSDPNNLNQYLVPSSLYFDDEDGLGFALVSDVGANGSDLDIESVIAVDVVSGYRVYFSRNISPEFVGCEQDDT